MKYVYYRINTLETKDVPVPDIDSNEILLKHKASGISTSDILAFSNGTVSKLYHKNAGEVHLVGSDVEGFTVENSVYYNTFINCGECTPCQKGWNNLCSNRKTVLPDSQAYAEYTILPKMLLQSEGVMKSTSSDYGALTHVGPLSNCIHSVEKTGVVDGESVVIIGAGYMGLLHLMLLKAMGVRDITITDINENRLDLALKLGASQVINPMKDEAQREADAVIVCTSNLNAMRDAVEMATWNGRVNFFGGMAMVDQGKYVGINANGIHYREIQVTGSYSSKVPRHYREALRLIEKGLVDPSPLDTNTVKLDEVNLMFDVIDDPSSLRVIVTD